MTIVVDTLFIWPYGSLMNATELNRIWKELEAVADEECADGALQEISFVNAMELNESDLREWLRDNRTVNDIRSLRERADLRRMDGGYDD